MDERKLITISHSCGLKLKLFFQKPPPAITSTAAGSNAAMAAHVDPSSREAVPKKQSAPFKFLVPLVYAPALPLIRIALRKNPVVRDRLFTAVLAGAFAHGFYLVTDIYDAESK